MANAKGNLRSDLGRVRGLGSAKEGVQHWWVQRVTAIALIPLSLWFVACIVFLIDVDRATAIQWLGSPVTLGLMGLFLIAHPGSTFTAQGNATDGFTSFTLDVPNVGLGGDAGSFTYTVSDGAGGTDVVTVTVNQGA